jgi:hypothetical protein
MKTSSAAQRPAEDYWRVDDSFNRATEADKLAGNLTPMALT